MLLFLIHIYYNNFIFPCQVRNFEKFAFQRQKSRFRQSCLILLGDFAKSQNKIKLNLRDTEKSNLMKKILDNEKAVKYNKRNETAKAPAVLTAALPFF
ncbi:MAG TPA: hypothetical protein DCP17_05180 [Ruminococcaceae bacterium]|nr:hypothetical protein [Oscillospiraceae bacterium]